MCKRHIDSRGLVVSQAAPMLPPFTGQHREWKMGNLDARVRALEGHALQLNDRLEAIEELLAELSATVAPGHVAPALSR